MVGRNVIGAGTVAILIAVLAFVTPLDAAKRRTAKGPAKSTDKAAATETAAVAAKAGPSKVTSVRFWSLGDVTRVAIETTTPFKYRSERIGSPERLFFDIAGARPALDADGASSRNGMKVIAVGDSVLKQIRVAETLPGKTRIVLDLEGKPEFTSSQMTNPDRLVIEIRSAERGAPTVTPSVSRSTRLSESPVREMAPDIGNPRAAVDAKIPPVAEPPVSNGYRKPARVFDPPPALLERRNPELPKIALLESAQIFRLEKPIRPVPGPAPTLLAGLTRSERSALRAPGEPKPVERPEPSRIVPSREREATSFPAKCVPGD